MSTERSAPTSRPCSSLWACLRSRESDGSEVMERVKKCEKRVQTEKARGTTHPSLFFAFNSSAIPCSSLNPSQSSFVLTTVDMAAFFFIKLSTPSRADLGACRACGCVGVGVGECECGRDSGGWSGGAYGSSGALRLSSAVHQDSVHFHPAAVPPLHAGRGMR
jgi:hypothetical protein